MEPVKSGETKIVAVIGGCGAECSMARAIIEASSTIPNGLIVPNVPGGTMVDLLNKETKRIEMDLAKLANDTELHLYESQSRRNKRKNNRKKKK